MALAESGFDEVVSVPLTEATQAWAKSIARANGHEKTAVCILDRESVSLSVIDTRNGAIKTKTTISRDSTGLIDWLSTAFGRNGSQPESLYLIGSRSELVAITGPLDEGLSIPVVASLDAELVLARSAALSGLTHVFDDTAAEGRSRLASRVRVITVAAAVAVAAMFVLSSAGGPNRLAASESQEAATPSTTATSTADIPTGADPVAPLVFPPPPAAAAQPVPTESPQATIPRASAPAETVAVPSATVAAPVPETVPVAPIPPPVETIPPPPPDPTAEDLGALLSALAVSTDPLGDLSRADPRRKLRPH